MSKPAAPVIAAAYDTPGFAYDAAIKGNDLYIAAELSGVIKLDISQPVSPRYAGSFDTPGEAVQLALVGDLLYVSDTYSLMILK